MTQFFTMTFRLRSGIVSDTMRPSFGSENERCTESVLYFLTANPFRGACPRSQAADHFARELHKLSPKPGQERGQHALHLTCGWPMSEVFPTDIPSSPQLDSMACRRSYSLNNMSCLAWECGSVARDVLMQRQKQGICRLPRTSHCRTDLPSTLPSRSIGAQ
jgi:hypothetical protein